MAIIITFPLPLSTTLTIKEKKSKLFFTPNRYSILAENEANTSDHKDTNQNECLHTTKQVEK